MRHATAKFGSLVHRFGMISTGLHARDFFRNWIDNTPIFSRTERVSAESPATSRESCSTEMKRIWPFWARPTLKVYPQLFVLVKSSQELLPKYTEQR